MFITNIRENCYTRPYMYDTKHWKQGLVNYIIIHCYYYCFVRIVIINIIIWFYSLYYSFFISVFG